MLISDTIAAFIDEMLSDCGGTLEIKRNDLAKRLGCVPSQINYVVASRFTPERGYIIESRRGGGGYIRIIRKRDDPQQQLADFLHALPSALSEPEVLRLLERLITFSLLSEREARLLAACCSDALLEPINQPYRDRHRARTFATALHRLTV